MIAESSRGVATKGLWGVSHSKRYAGAFGNFCFVGKSRHSDHISITTTTTTVEMVTYCPTSSKWLPGVKTGDADGPGQVSSLTSTSQCTESYMEPAFTVLVQVSQNCPSLHKHLTKFCTLLTMRGHQLMIPYRDSQQQDSIGGCRSK